MAEIEYTAETKAEIKEGQPITVALRRCGVAGVDRRVEILCATQQGKPVCQPIQLAVDATIKDLEASVATELALDLDEHMHVFQNRGGQVDEQFLESDLTIVAVLWHSNQLTLKFGALLKATPDSLPGKTITASFRRDDSGLEVRCTLLSAKEHCRLFLNATSTLWDLQNSVAEEDHDLHKQSL